MFLLLNFGFTYHNFRGTTPRGLGFVNESRDGLAGDGARGFVEELGASGFTSESGHL